MMSKTLVRLIDQAIVPAILLLCTRFASVIFISYYSGIKFSFDQSGFVFPSQEALIYVNSYSTFFMILVLTVGILYILMKALFFHDTHITPRLTAKLFNYRVSSFIQSSFELYSQGIIWLAYSVLVTSITAVFASMGYIYTWVFYVGLVMTVISIVILIIDIEHEMHLGKQERGFN